MISTRKRRQQKRKILSQFEGNMDEFVVRSGNQNTQNESKIVQTLKFFCDTNHLIFVNDSAGKMQTLERIVLDRVCFEVENIVATVKIRMHDAILAAMDSLVSPRIELKKQSMHPLDRTLAVLYLTQTTRFLRQRR